MAVTAATEAKRVKVRDPETLRIAISKSGYAPSRLAAILQVRRDTLSQITSGRIRTTETVAKQISVLVDRDINDLFKLDFNLPVDDPAMQIASAACAGVA